MFVAITRGYRAKRPDTETARHWITDPIWGLVQRMPHCCRFQLCSTILEHDLADRNDCELPGTKTRHARSNSSAKVVLGAFHPSIIWCGSIVAESGRYEGTHLTSILVADLKAPAPYMGVRDASPSVSILDERDPATVQVPEHYPLSSSHSRPLPLRRKPR